MNAAREVGFPSDCWNIQFVLLYENKTFFCSNNNIFIRSLMAMRSRFFSNEHLGLLSDKTIASDMHANLCLDEGTD
jgi:hypothetical protein